jgi:hypothetical protein
LQATLYKNHNKLNVSFSDYFHSEMSVSKDLLRKKKITKLKKVEDQGEKAI